MMKPTKSLELKLGYTFTDHTLLVQALTHRSYPKKTHNERLEFLGDVVLSLVISRWMYEQYPALSEGKLTRLRAQLVNKDTLQILATEYQISDYILAGSNEKKDLNNQYQASILVNTFEAIIAAIYLDKGLDAVTRCIQIWYQPLLAQHATDQLAQKDPKTTLQELCQARQLSLPVYTLKTTTGKPHQLHFHVICQINDTTYAAQEGSGRTKRIATQHAATNMIQEIINHDQD